MLDAWEVQEEPATTPHNSVVEPPEWFLNATNLARLGAPIMGAVSRPAVRSLVVAVAWTLCTGMDKDVKATSSAGVTSKLESTLLVGSLLLANPNRQAG
jgi:hypothetical protein